jgi:hypothetical protein
MQLDLIHFRRLLDCVVARLFAAFCGGRRLEVTEERWP